MSEFFKALEQAERDRQLAEATERPVTATNLTESGPLTDAAGGTDGVRTRDETPAADASPPPAAAAAAPPAPAVPPPAKDRPAEVPRSRLADRGPSAPAPPAAPPGPFRRPPVQNRAAAPVQERAIPVETERPAPPVPQRVGVPGSDRSAPAGDRSGAAAPAEAPAPIQRATRPPKKRGDLPVLIADLDPRSVAAEAYRTLRANLEFGSSERPYRNVIVTSPSMGEGKSTTAANLAVVAAQGGSRVCLVDADMRRPALHKVFGVPNQGGLTRALSHGASLSSVAVATGIPNLSLVVAGSADGLRPAQLLTGPRLQRVLHGPENPFDLVLFDTPPVISVADAMNLAAHCDGVLLVVRAGAVTPKVLQQAVRQINHVNGKVLGVLLNHVDLGRGDAEYYRHYRAYYSSMTKD